MPPISAGSRLKNIITVLAKNNLCHPKWLIYNFYRKMFIPIFKVICEQNMFILILFICHQEVQSSHYKKVFWGHCAFPKSQQPVRMCCLSFIHQRLIVAVFDVWSFQVLVVRHVNGNGKLVLQKQHPTEVNNKCSWILD